MKSNDTIKTYKRAEAAIQKRLRVILREYIRVILPDEDEYINRLIFKIRKDGILTTWDEVDCNPIIPVEVFYGGKKEAKMWVQAEADRLEKLKKQSEMRKVKWDMKQFEGLLERYPAETKKILDRRK